MTHPHIFHSSPEELRCRMIRRSHGEGTDAIRYVLFCYTPTTDVRCRFPLLCECRDDAAAEFKRIISAKGYEPVQVEIPVRPWIVTQLRKRAA